MTLENSAESGAYAYNFSVGFPATPAVGNLLIVACNGKTSPPTTPTGWTLVGSNTGTNEATFVFAKTADGTESNFVAVTSVRQVKVTIYQEFSGNDGSTANAVLELGRNSSPNSGSIAVSSSENELLFAVGAGFNEDEASHTITINSGFTEIRTRDFAAQVLTTTSYKSLAGGGGTETVSFVMSPSAILDGIAATFPEAAASGGATEGSAIISRDVF